MIRRKRTIAYVDGFNLYHAVGDLGANYLKWLDLRALTVAFAPRSDHDMVQVVYFTAYAHWRPESSARHAIYVAALQAKGITAHLGRFKARSRQCRACGARWTDHEEKESDVSLGITMVRDAMQARYDRALLFTRDSDLVPAVRMARDVSSSADILIISPEWHRKPSELITTAGGRGHHRFLRRIHLERALLPAEVCCDGGNSRVQRPAAYDPPRTDQ
ncbi:MAG: NYN domain-containing protein [bacterium]|nr:NYN domain-containing protein [bacterium]